MFRGRFEHTMDANGRISLPAPFRAALEKGDSQPILTLGAHHVRVYPSDVWTTYEESILATSDFLPEADTLRRFEISNCSDGRIDGQGRLSVPQYMRDRAHLRRDVVIAGVGKHVELWDLALFEVEMSRAQETYAELRRAVAGHARRDESS
jgi:MraZ protein